MSHELDLETDPAVASQIPYGPATPGKRSMTGGLGASVGHLASRVATVLQRRAALADGAPGRDDNGVAPDADQAVERASRGGGAPLPDDLRARFETSLGTDLSAVRVHTGAESAAANAAVGARAFALGDDIHFDDGQYRPDDAFGLHLLAHEVAHTVQQRDGAPLRQHKLRVSEPGDAAEREADRAADAMVAGRSAVVSGAAGLGRLVARDKDPEDPYLSALPKEPTFVPADGSFAAMGKAMDASMKGGPSAVVSPDSGFAGAIANLDATVAHAQGSQTYYNNNANKYDPGNLNAALGKVAADDATWAISALADVNAARSGTSGFLALVNGSNEAWAALTKQANAMSIDVHQKVEDNPFGALTGGPTKKLGDQVIDANEVGGAGMGLAVSAKRAGIIGGPDTTAYQKAMQEFNTARDAVIPKERRVFASTQAAKTAAIENWKSAKEEEKAKWETIKTATETFATGITIAAGGASFVEGELGAATIGDAGGSHLVVNKVGDKKSVGVMDTTKTDIVKTKAPEVKEIASTGGSWVGKLIQLKIDKIAAQIATYDNQLGQYRQAQEVQNAKANVEEYQNALKELRTKAANLEVEQANMEKRMIEWGQKVDAELIKQGKATKGSTDNAEAAQLLAKIRSAKVATEGAVEGLSGAASLPKLYGDVAAAAKARGTAEAGRRDKRYQVFGIESQRWSVAAGAVGDIGAALGRRLTQIATLESSFLTTFMQHGATDPAGAKVGSSY